MGADSETGAVGIGRLTLTMVPSGFLTLTILNAAGELDGVAVTSAVAAPGASATVGELSSFTIVAGVSLDAIVIVTGSHKNDEDISRPPKSRNRKILRR